MRSSVNVPLRDGPIARVHHVQAHRLAGSRARRVDDAFLVDSALAITSARGRSALAARVAYGSTVDVAMACAEVSRAGRVAPVVGGGQREVGNAVGLQADATSEVT